MATSIDEFCADGYTTAKHPEAAMQLIQFLKSPAAVQVIKAKGMTPE